MRRLKVLVFVDSDILVRHFLDSGVLNALAARHDVQLVLPPEGYRRLISVVPADGWGLKWQRVSIPEQRRHQWRRIFYVDQARLRRGADWAEIRRGWRVMIGWKASLQFSLYALPGIRPVVVWCMRRRLAQAPAKQLDVLIDKERPDILIHPSTFDGYFINDVIAAGNTRQLPVVLLMNSWDNPALKRAAVGHPTAVTVWGEQSRQHAIRFMGLAPAAVHILGAAQFDVYRNQPTETRDAICREHDIDPAHRILMYAGSSKGNREAQHLRWLSEAVARGDLAGTTIMYRPHPFGLDAAYAREILASTSPHIRIESSMMPMLQRIASGQTGGFHITPYTRTHALLNAVDALISPLSTIILEAGLHGKPVMCFIPEEEDRDSIWKNLRNLVHFRDLMTSSGVIAVRTHAAFLPAVSALMAKVGDQAYADKVRRAMSVFVEFPDRPFADGLVSLCEHLSTSRAA